jgi:hypothetical protein
MNLSQNPSLGRARWYERRLLGRLFVVAVALSAIPVLHDVRAWEGTDRGGYGGEPAPDTGYRSEIRALVRLFRAYDLSVGSIEFETVQWAFPQRYTPGIAPEPAIDPTDPSTPSGWLGWGRSWMGQHGYDREDAYIWGHFVGSSGGFPIRLVDVRGYRRSPAGAAPGSLGVLCGVRDQNHAKTLWSPTTPMFRGLERFDTLSMSEVMVAAAREGRIDLQDDAVGRPCLSFALMDRPWIRVSLWLDPDHGFAPRRVCFWDTNRERPASDLRVVEFTRFDGLWIPVVSTSTSYHGEVIKRADRENRQRSFEEVRRVVETLDLPTELGRAGPRLRQAVLEMLITGEEKPPASLDPGKVVFWEPPRNSLGQLYAPQISMARVLTLNRGLTDLPAITRWDTGSPVRDYFARVQTTFGSEPGSWVLEDAPIGAPGAESARANTLPSVAPPSDPPALPAVREVHPPNVPGVVVGQLDLLAIARADPENQGVRRVGSSVQRTVTFGNPTLSPLRVKITGTTCGCTSAMFSRVEVAPGETTDLTLKATVPASPTLQRQFVSFTVERVGGDGAGEPPGLPPRQSAMVGIAYRADWSVKAEPERVRRIVRVGEEVRSVLSFYSGPPSFTFPLDRLTCTLSELTLSGPKRFVTDPPSPDTDFVRALVLGGVFEAPGLYEGAVREPEELVQGQYSPLEIPVVVKVEPGWTSDPHAWASRRPPLPEERLTLRLRPVNERVPSVVAVRLFPADAPARADLRHEADGTATLEVVFSEEAAQRRAEGFDLVLLDEQGRVQLEIPVAWWSVRQERSSP